MGKREGTAVFFLYPREFAKYVQNDNALLRSVLAANCTWSLVTWSRLRKTIETCVKTFWIFADTPDMTYIVVRGKGMVDGGFLEHTKRFRALWIWDTEISLRTKCPAPT